MKTVVRAVAFIQHSRAMLVDPRGRMFGGKARKGEFARDALRRVLRRDLGIDVIPGKVAFILEGVSKKHRCVDIAFQCDVEGHRIVPAEGKVPQWAGIPEELPVELPPVN